MNTEQQIEAHFLSLPESKQSEMKQLHQTILQLLPGCRLWFSDGKDENNKTVTNPTVGYGSLIMKYANGKTKEVFRIGLSATGKGISVYILGIEDKKYLAETFGNKLGKAKVTGYCISFKTISDVNMDVLNQAIRFGFELYS